MAAGSLPPLAQSAPSVAASRCGPGSKMARAVVWWHVVLVCMPIGCAWRWCLQLTCKMALMCLCWLANSCWRARSWQKGVNMVKRWCDTHTHTHAVTHSHTHSHTHGIHTYSSNGAQELQLVGLAPKHRQQLARRAGGLQCAVQEALLGALARSSGAPVAADH